MTVIRVTQARVAYSEWIKLRSLRSTAWTLSVTAVLTVGIGALLSGVVREHLERSGSAHPHVGVGAVTLSLFGVYLAQLTIGLLGVLVATGEYTTGMIRATLTAVPRRLTVLWAKLGVFALVVAVTSIALLLVTFLAGQAILSGAHAGVSLADPGVLRAVTGTGLYLTVVGLLGIALGFAIRNTTAATAIIFIVLLVVPEILGAALPASVAPSILPYLPSNAGQAIMVLGPAPETLAPWTGLGLFTAYTAAAVAAAAILLKRRDA